MRRSVNNRVIRNHFNADVCIFRKRFTACFPQACSVNKRDKTLQSLSKADQWGTEIIFISFQKSPCFSALKFSVLAVCTCECYSAQVK